MKALKREVKEEMGLFLKNAVFYKKYENTFQGEKKCLYVYLVKMNFSISDIVLNEGEGLEFVTFREALRLFMPEEDRALLDEVRFNLGFY